MKKLENLIIGISFAGSLSLADTVHAAYKYIDYAKEYDRCANLPKSKVSKCQKRAKTRYDCAQSGNEDGCLAKRDPELFEEKKREDQIRQEQEVKRQAKAVADAAAWTEAVSIRKTDGTGHWITREGDPDPIDDSRVVVVSLEADSGRSSLGGETITLVLRCSSNKTSMYINWGDYVTDSTTVTHRFDKEKPITKEWPSSTDKTASFYFGSGFTIAKKLMVSDRFVARTTPYNENPVTAIFDTRGLSKAIEPLRDACNW